MGANTIRCLLGCLLSVTAVSLAGEETRKRPLRGGWDFDPQEEWKVTGVENEPFGRIAELLVLEGGQLHVRDFTNHVSYLFDESGQLIASLGRHGEQPGELSRYINRFAAGDKLVLGSPDALHFFSADGSFVRSFPNNLFERFPLLFLDETSFIYAPPEVGASPGQKRLMQADLATGEEKLLHSFGEPATDRPATQGQALSVQVVGLTPAVLLDGDGQHLYFGMNDTYVIHVTNMTGQQVRRFALERPASPVSEEERRRHLSGSRLTAEQIDDMVPRLPDRLTFFHRIQVLGDLLYVFTTEGIGRRHDRQGIDVFSTEGEYLYRGSIAFDESQFFGGPDNLVVEGERMYVVLEQEAGPSVVKHRIRQPAR